MNTIPHLGGMTFTAPHLASLLLHLDTGILLLLANSILCPALCNSHSFSRSHFHTRLQQPPCKSMLYRVQHCMVACQTQRVDGMLGCHFVQNRCPARGTMQIAVGMCDKAEQVLNGLICLWSKVQNDNTSNTDSRRRLSTKFHHAMHDIIM